MLYPFLISLIAGMSTVVGGLIIFIKFKSKNINKFIVFCLSFSLIIMIGISIFDLLPHSWINLVKTYGLLKGSGVGLVAFLFGYLIIKIFKKSTIKCDNKSSLYKIGILSMITLMIHNFPEGIATFMTSYTDIKLGISLSIAIMLHNIPEGISIAVPIYYATNSKTKALSKTFISGLFEPLGAIIAFIFLKNYISDTFISITLIIVAGLMISLAIEELFIETIKYKENKYISIGFIVGIIVLFITILQ